MILVGRVGKDPEIRATQGGKRFASFSLATSERWKDKRTGERQERTEWHNISVAADGLVTIVENYVGKGSLIYLEGALQTRKWTDRSGQERYTTEVVIPPFRGVLTLMGGRGDGGGGGKGGEGYQPRSRDNAGAGADAADDPAYDLDDEIPY